MIARQAAAVLSAEEDAHVSDGIRLLEDIRDVFGSDTFPPTSLLLGLLYKVDESRWEDYYGSQLLARRLASLLEPYSISPRQERIGEGQDPTRGYFRIDFEDAWRRHLQPAQDKAVQAVQAVQLALDDDYRASATEVD